MALSTQEETRARLLELLEAEADAHEIDIVDVEVVGASKAPTVRVRIDHVAEDADPITLDEVSAETAWISDLIDEADPIEGHYNLEVSSPGLARPLRKRRDFVRFAGENVSLTLNVSEGRRKYTGRLEGMEDDRVRITTDEGEFSFDLADIKSAKIKPDYEKLARAAKSAQKE
jgi:ribosome maturation factor RimP